MFKRPHHQRIAKLLKAFNPELLQQANCYFGGGTAIALALGEYRESVDIDFLCADIAGYRMLRSALAGETFGSLVTVPLTYRREVRTSRDKISAFVEVDDAPIKVEFVLEGRIPLDGAFSPSLGVPVLSREDLYAEKLLANADRGQDRSVRSRDLIDLGAMINQWGPIPDGAWAKATAAYGDSVRASYEKSLALIQDERYYRKCAEDMSMDPMLAQEIYEALEVKPVADDEMMPRMRP